MATPSQFNRPYAELKGGTGSLANRPATASGRGYYAPDRILERVARGRPGTTMQQAQGAIAAEGYKEYDKLRSQMGQQQQPQMQTAMQIQPSVQQPTPPPPNPMNPAQPQQKRGGIGSYLDMMTQGWNALGAAAKPFGL